MFVGHCAPAIAAIALANAPSLGDAVLAVLIVDIVWAGFILAGVEHARAAPGFLEMSNLELYESRTLIRSLAP